jgi:hypothetical protein
MVYGQNNIVAEGPKRSRVYADGRQVILQYDIKKQDEQLVASDKYGYVKGFEIAAPINSFILLVRRSPAIKLSFQPGRLASRSTCGMPGPTTLMQTCLMPMACLQHPLQQTSAGKIIFFSRLVEIPFSF